MLLIILVAYVVFSAVLAWRLVNVIVHSTDAAHRQAAIATLGKVWGTGTVCSAIVLTLTQIYQLPLL